MTGRNAVLMFLGAMMSTGSLLASDVPPHVIFRESSATRFSPEKPRELFPSTFRALVLDEDALQAALQEVPTETGYADGEPAPSFALLTPDGAVSEFAVMEAQVMD